MVDFSSISVFIHIGRIIISPSQIVLKLEVPTGGSLIRDDENPIDAEDSELVRRVLAGEERAFSLLCKRHNTRLFSYVCEQTGDWHDAQDVVQETYVKVFENLGELRESKKLRSWMLRIAHRLSMDMHRDKEKRIGNISLDRIPNEANVLEVASVIEHRRGKQREEYRGFEEGLFRAIAKLPESERETLLLQIDGMSHKKIAQVLDITEAAVNGRLARARKKVEVHLLENDSDTPNKPSDSKDPRENRGGGNTCVAVFGTVYWAILSLVVVPRFVSRHLKESLRRKARSFVVFLKIY